MQYAECSSVCEQSCLQPQLSATQPSPTEGKPISLQTRRLSQPRQVRKAAGFTRSKQLNLTVTTTNSHPNNSSYSVRLELSGICPQHHAHPAAPNGVTAHFSFPLSKHSVNTIKASQHSALDLCATGTDQWKRAHTTACHTHTAHMRQQTTRKQPRQQHSSSSILNSHNFTAHIHFGSKSPVQRQQRWQRQQPPACSSALVESSLHGQCASDPTLSMQLISPVSLLNHVGPETIPAMEIRSSSALEPSQQDVAFHQTHAAALQLKLQHALTGHASQLASMQLEHSAALRVLEERHVLSSSRHMEELQSVSKVAAHCAREEVLAAVNKDRAAEVSSVWAEQQQLAERKLCVMLEGLQKLADVVDGGRVICGQ